MKQHVTIMLMQMLMMKVVSMEAVVVDGGSYQSEVGWSIVDCDDAT